MRGQCVAAFKARMGTCTCLFEVIALGWFLPCIAQFRTLAVHKAHAHMSAEMHAVAMPAQVGGKFGNVVTSSDISKIHRGWRIVAVNGQRLAAEEVPSALITAQKSVKYSLTFYLDPGADADRLEKERLRKEQLEKERLEKERLEKERLEQEHLEKERLEKERLEEERLEKERVEKERLEKERLDKELLEKERLDKERQQNLLEERLEKERLEEELKKARLETEAKVVRGAAERRLETSTGLPPRETVAEPQRALLAALVPAKATAPAKARNTHLPIKIAGRRLGASLLETGNPHMIGPN